MTYLSWDLGVAMMSEYDADGFLGVQIDAYGKAAGVHPYEAHAIGGFLSRPLDPEVDESGEPLPAKACATLIAMEGGHGHAIPLGDPRVLQFLPPLRKGGSIQFSSILDTDGKTVIGAGFSIYDGKTGSQLHYVPYAFGGDKKPTKAMSLAINVDASGKEFISLIHGDGTAIELSGGKVTIKSGGGTAFVTLGDDGLEVSGGATIHGGVSLGDESAMALIMAEPFLVWAQALEIAMKAAVPPIVSPVLIATVIEAMKTKFTKAS